MDKKLRLKRHGIFSIREGWLEKAINAISENDKSVFGKDNGVAVLGIGSNMVTSLRYWMIATGIIQSKDSKFTSFGELLRDYDPYLDSNFSWWMIHQKLVTNDIDAPIFNITFNHFKANNFKKDVLNDFIKNYLKDNGFDMSNSIQIDADTTVLLRTYITEKITEPENNLSCPLGKLGLLKRNKDDLYNFVHPGYDRLPFLAVYYSLLRCLNGKDSVNIDDLIEMENSPYKVFKLDKNLLYLYLNDMKQAGLVTLNKTAGLNMVYIQKELDEKEIFEHFFRESGK